MNNNQKIVYGRLAYEGFAKALASKLGMKVEIDDGDSPCIDEKGTIHMPGLDTYQTAEEFANTCGTIVHEMAHQFYKSHKLIDPKRSALEHQCLNAVLDVADETWIDAYFTTKLARNTRPGQLLTSSGAACVRDNYTKYLDWANASTNLWKTLCAGIFNARLRGSYARRSVFRIRYEAERQAKTFNVDAKQVYKILNAAKFKDGIGPAPTPKRFVKLLKLAQKLAVVLKPFEQQAKGMPALPMGFAHGAGDKKGKEKSAAQQALEAGKLQVPKGAIVADAKDGANACAVGSNVGGGTGAGAGNSRGYGKVPFEPSAFALVAPAIQRIAQRIATDGDGIDRETGLMTGSTVSQPHRLSTDGACMGRWQMNDHAEGLAVAVVLDCSGSMQGHLPECAGVARAFALGLRDAGEVKSYIFGDYCEESDNFEYVKTMGGTQTDYAMKQATKWLEAQSAGSKWMIVITDGQPNDLLGTNAACAAARAQKIKLMGVGLNCKINFNYMTSFTAASVAHLAIELDHAAHLIEAE